MVERWMENRITAAAFAGVAVAKKHLAQIAPLYEQFAIVCILCMKMRQKITASPTYTLHTDIILLEYLEALLSHNIHTQIAGILMVNERTRTKLHLFIIYDER